MNGNLAKMAKLADINYPQMQGLILKAAEDRVQIGDKMDNTVTIAAAAAVVR